MSNLTSFASAEFAWDKLFAGPTEGIVTRKVTLASGENRTRGAVLGKVTADGKYKLSAAAAGDGSETPDAVLAEDCDASGGDTEALAYFTGHFNDAAVTLGAGHTVASIREGLRDKGIHLITVQS